MALRPGGARRLGVRGGMFGGGLGSHRVNIRSYGPIAPANWPRLHSSHASSRRRRNLYSLNHRARTKISVI
jgi:hypothetical protein